MEAGATGGATACNGATMNREQMKKMSEADKEMELRANRAKALLAERHIGLKTNQVSVGVEFTYVIVRKIVFCCLIGGYHMCIFAYLYIFHLVDLTSALLHRTPYHIFIHKSIDYIHKLSRRSVIRGRCNLKHK